MISGQAPASQPLDPQFDRANQPVPGGLPSSRTRPPSGHRPEAQEPRTVSLVSVVVVLVIVATLMDLAPLLMGGDGTFGDQQFRFPLPHHVFCLLAEHRGAVADGGLRRVRPPEELERTARAHTPRVFRVG